MFRKLIKIVFGKTIISSVIQWLLLIPTVLAWAGLLRFLFPIVTTGEIMMSCFLLGFFWAAFWDMTRMFYDD